MIINSGFTRLCITKNTTDWLNIYISEDYAIIRSYMTLSASCQSYTTSRKPDRYLPIYSCILQMRPCNLTDQKERSLIAPGRESIKRNLIICSLFRTGRCWSKPANNSMNHPAYCDSITRIQIRMLFPS
jgi:hypothetical protein